MEGLTKDFDDFISKRTEELWREDHQKTSDLARLEGRIAQLQRELEGKLEKNQQDLFLQYEELINQEMAYLRQAIYRIGFRDGIRIMEGTEARFSIVI